MKYQIDEKAVSAIGYGCMELGGSWDSNPVSKDQLIKATGLVEQAIEQGINLFDHADIYCFGKSERIFSDILKQNPSLKQNILIQSKCAIGIQDKPSQGMPQRYDWSFKGITESVEGILTRLGIEKMDGLLLHRPDALMEPEEVAKAFDQLQAQGKVGYFGLSNTNTAQMMLLQQYIDQPIVVNQVELSLVHHGLIAAPMEFNVTANPYANDTGFLEYCRMNNILVQAWSPQAGGRWQDNSELSAVIKRLSNQYEVSDDAILLAWLLRHPSGIQPVIGTSNVQRLQQCAQAVAVELSREDWYALLLAARGQALP